MMSVARADLRKGWCPGALRPMMAKDGVLVRLRITGGIVSAATARGIADLAEASGNGLFDLSARANLQMRGVRETGLQALLDGLRELGLLDVDAEGEAVRNVLASPLAGLGGSPDVRALTAALEARLASDSALHGLPSKFGFLIDDGSTPSLASIPADVRFDWLVDKQVFAVGLGGTSNDARFAGRCAPHEVVERAADIGLRVVEMRAASGKARRMCDLLSDLGPRAVDLFGLESRGDHLDAERDILATAGLHIFDGVSTLGLAVPFGRLDATMLRLAAGLAEDAGQDELRLTPWRTVLVPHVVASSVNLDTLTRAGFIIDASDPRLAVAACVGAAGCARGTTRTHEDATALSDLAATLVGDVTPLHVSGCDKGCAKPSRSAVTLVGRAARYDLVLNGRPGDSSALQGLDLAQVRAALSAMPGAA